jgi:hypothetical protein
LSRIDSITVALNQAAGQTAPGGYALKQKMLELEIEKEE